MSEERFPCPEDDCDFEEVAELSNHKKVAPLIVEQHYAREHAPPVGAIRGRPP